MTLQGAGGVARGELDVDDYVDQSVGEPSVISRRALIRKGMRVAGAGLWAVPVVAVVARNNGGSGGQQVTQVVAPANHGGPAVATCIMAGSPGGCITFVCGGVLTECVGTPPPACGPAVCFCQTDISGVCRCVANSNCADLQDCPNFGAPNGGCPAGTVCVNPFSCCNAAKCAFVCN